MYESNLLPRGADATTYPWMAVTTPAYLMTKHRIRLHLFQIRQYSVRRVLCATPQTSEKNVDKINDLVLFEMMLFFPVLNRHTTEGCEQVPPTTRHII